jgi:hypothetical protein
LRFGILIDAHSKPLCYGAIKSNVIGRRWDLDVPRPARMLFAPVASSECFAGAGEAVDQRQRSTRKRIIERLLNLPANFSNNDTLAERRNPIRLILPKRSLEVLKKNGGAIQIATRIETYPFKISREMIRGELSASELIIISSIECHHPIFELEKEISSDFLQSALLMGEQLQKPDQLARSGIIQNRDAPGDKICHEAALQCRAGRIALLPAWRSIFRMSCIAHVPRLIPVQPGIP